jgi:S-adenosylmethionine uptake transporter
VRLASDQVHVFEVVFFRNFFNLVFMLPWLARIGFVALRTKRLGLHALRSSFSLVSMFLQFSALALMPLADATAISFAAPLFAVIGAALVVGETVRLRRWMAILVGFVGVGIILRPGMGSVDAAALMMLAGSIVVGASFTCVKLLSRTESPNAMVLFMGLFLAPASLVPALFVWEWPGATGWLCLVSVGICATGRGGRERRAALRLPAPPVRGRLRLSVVRGDARPVDVDRRRRDRGRQYLHRPARGFARQAGPLGRAPRRR